MDFSRKVLYHATSLNAAQKIQEEGLFKPGTRGFAGPAIYFSEHEEAAVRKCQNGQPQYAEVIIVCEVDVGHVVMANVGDMDKAGCISQGGNSVKIIGKDVWAIYDPARIRIKDVKYLTTRTPTAAVLALLQRLQLEESNVVTNEQEAQQHVQFVKDYTQWGKGRLLGGKHVMQGDVEGLRGARLAKFGALSAEKPPTVKAPRVSVEADMDRQQAQLIQPTQHARMQTTRAASMEVTAPALHAPQHYPATAEEEDEDVNMAILLSMQAPHDMQLSEPMQTAADSSASDPVGLPTTEEAEDSDFQMAVWLSMQDV